MPKKVCFNPMNNRRKKYNRNIEIINIYSPIKRNAYEKFELQKRFNRSTG